MAETAVVLLGLEGDPLALNQVLPDKLSLFVPGRRTMPEPMHALVVVGGGRGRDDTNWMRRSWLANGNRLDGRRASGDGDGIGHRRRLVGWFVVGKGRSRDRGREGTTIGSNGPVVRLSEGVRLRARNDRGFDRHGSNGVVLSLRVVDGRMNGSAGVDIVVRPQVEGLALVSVGNIDIEVGNRRAFREVAILIPRDDNAFGKVSLDRHLGVFCIDVNVFVGSG